MTARTARRRRLALLTATLTLTAATVTQLAEPDRAGSSPTAFVQHCHSTPDDLAWCEWLIFMDDPANAAWFAWATAPKVSASSWTVWDELRLCEAPDWAGGWQANTGNGFYGGLQFTLRSWQWVGGTGYPHHHTRETQIAMGERLLAKQGWGAWPACSKRLGLR